MVEGGLVEVSIHVDTTQRGRLGEQWRRAKTEAELNPLRAEFAPMIRAAEETTGRTLRAATTMTVTRDNLDSVTDVVRWLTEHTDAFRLISFQPIAQVGRTGEGCGGGVDVDALWDRVADGLGLPGGAERTKRMGVWFGHEACNRMVNGFVAQRRGAAPAFHALRDADADIDVRAVDGFLARFGGVSFRLDNKRAMIARAIGLLRTAPLFCAGILPPFAVHWLRRIGDGGAWRGLWRLLSGESKTTSLVLVSHHFMSKDELESPLGKQRLAHCVFRVPINGQMLSMCAVNALGIRERYCEALNASANGAISGATTGAVAALDASYVDAVTTATRRVQSA